MNMPKLTKKDKRTYAEIQMDEWINHYVDRVTTADEARTALGLMKQRGEIDSAKKPKIDPTIVCNIISGTVGMAQLWSIIKAEKVDFSILSKSAMSFVHKGRLR